MFFSISLFVIMDAEALTTKATYDDSGKTVIIDCEVITKGRLRYPPRAKRFNFVGEVTLGFSISSDGQVMDPHVIESSPPGLFEKSALKHIRSRVYKPPLFDDKPVKVTDAKVKIIFRPN